MTWNIKLLKDNPLYPALVIDNWYTPNEEKAVWKELDFYSATPKKYLEKAEDTIVARDKDGSPRSTAYRFYLETFYNNKLISPIYNCMKKQRSPEFRDIMGNFMPYARSFLSTTEDTSLISYYEDNDHYKPHYDSFSWTCLIWMVREPKLFDGGDFLLNEPNYEIKLKNNRMVMFPSCLLHSVTPLKFHTQPEEAGYGKYTITHFYFAIPLGDGSDLSLGNNKLPKLWKQ